MPPASNAIRARPPAAARTNPSISATSSTPSSTASPTLRLVTPTPFQDEIMVEGYCPTSGERLFHHADRELLASVGGAVDAPCPLCPELHRLVRRSDRS